MKVKLEYVWLDGYKPEPNLRSKVKIVEYTDITRYIGDVNKLPKWNFDGSSTNQADTGNSDRILNPVAMYKHYNFPSENKTILMVLHMNLI